MGHSTSLGPFLPGKRHRTIRHQEQGHSKAAPAAQRVLAHGPRGGRQSPTSRPNNAHRGRAACRRGSAPASWCRAPRGRAPGPGTAPSPAEVCAREGDASARRTGAVDAAALAERALHVASAMRPRLHQTTCNIRVHQNGDAPTPPPNHLQPWHSLGIHQHPAPPSAHLDAVALAEHLLHVGDAAITFTKPLAASQSTTIS